MSFLCIDLNYIQVPGSGLNLALQRVRVGLAAPAQLIERHALAAAGMPVPVAAVGQVPPFWDPNLGIDGFTDETVLLLIEFYNVDFGIVVGDTLPARKDKLRTWMTE